MKTGTTGLFFGTAAVLVLLALSSCDNSLIKSSRAEGEREISALSSKEDLALINDGPGDGEIPVIVPGDETPVDVDMSQNFSDSLVRVTLTRETRFLKEEYKPEDFPEVRLDRVEEFIPETWQIVLKQLEAERTGDWIWLEEQLKSGMLVNLATYTRILYLTLAEPGKENVVRAVELFGQRDDVQDASPCYIPWPQMSGPGSFPGLDVETEMQMKYDLMYYRNYLTVDAIRFDNYYGSYNDCVVALILGNALVVDVITVAGFNFGFPVSASILCWKPGDRPGNGRFYDVRKAYDLGLLTEGDIRNIYELYEGGKP